MPGKGGVVLIAAASPCIFKRICICPRRAERAPMLTRRKVMRSVALGAGALGLGIAPPRASADAGQLTFAGFGGTTQDAEKTAWADPFSAATGIQVIQDGPIDMGKIKAQVESGNVLWDVCDVQGPVAYLLAKQGMLEPIDYSVVKREHLDPRFTFDYGVAAFGSSYVLGYNKDVIKDKEPHNWADLFDTKTFPGKRAVFKWMSGAPFEIALMADGVPPDKLPWRFSDAGRPSVSRVCHCRRPKTCTIADIPRTSPSQRRRTRRWRCAAGCESCGIQHAEPTARPVAA